MYHGVVAGESFGFLVCLPCLSPIDISWYIIFHQHPTHYIWFDAVRADYDQVLSRSTWWVGSWTNHCAVHERRHLGLLLTIQCVYLLGWTTLLDWARWLIELNPSRPYDQRLLLNNIKRSFLHCGLFVCLHSWLLLPRKVTTPFQMGDCNPRLCRTFSGPIVNCEIPNVWSFIQGYRLILNMSHLLKMDRHMPSGDSEHVLDTIPMTYETECLWCQPPPLPDINWTRSILVTNSFELHGYTADRSISSTTQL